MAAAPAIVVHVVHSLGVGGTENGVVNVINSLAQGLRHAVVAVTESGPLAARLPAGTPVLALGKRPGIDPAAMLRLARALRRLRPDIVHTRNWGALDAVMAARLVRVPAVIHGEHGREVGDPTGLNRRRNRIRRALSPLVDRFVAVSHDLERWLVHTVGIPAGKVQTIHNGVDTERFSRRGPRGGPGRPRRGRRYARHRDRRPARSREGPDRSPGRLRRPAEPGPRGAAGGGRRPVPRRPRGAGGQARPRLTCAVPRRARGRRDPAPGVRRLRAALDRRGHLEHPARGNGLRAPGRRDPHGGQPRAGRAWRHRGPCARGRSPGPRRGTGHLQGGRPPSGSPRQGRARAGGRALLPRRDDPPPPRPLRDPGRGRVPDVCGIAGIAHVDPTFPVDRDLLRAHDRRHGAPRPRRGRASMLARGVGLGHRRLSIIDLADRATSRSSTRTARWRWSSTARSTTSRSSGRELEARGHRFAHALATPR